MTASSSASVVQNPSTSSWRSGRWITALAILFAILGAYELIWGSIIAYVFSSAHMLSLFHLGILFIVICQCVIYFLLVARIRRQPWLLSLALVAMAWLVLPIALRLTINASTVRVRNAGYSMGNTLPDASYILADRPAYTDREPERGDIVIFMFPPDPQQELIKRVIGLPGETIAVQDGTVTTNGTLLEEPYVTEPPLYEGTWTVPQDQYFVLGDNRNDSRDSHQWGYLPRENIIAKAVWIYFPLGDFGRIDTIDSPS